MRRLILALGLLGLLAPLATHAAAQPAGVSAEQPWARATAPRQTVGGVYVTLTSPVDDRLLSASSPVAGHAEVHEMTMEGNVMRMRELTGGLKLPAGQAVALAPGGLHVMLVDLKQPLAVGQVIPVQLRFEHAPPVDLQVRVAPVGAQAPGAASLGAQGSGMEHAH